MLSIAVGAVGTGPGMKLVDAEIRVRAHATFRDFVVFFKCIAPPLFFFFKLIKYPTLITVKYLHTLRLETKRKA